jgi:DNA-binding NarL/FixJ family response regulator
MSASTDPLLLLVLGMLLGALALYFLQQLLKVLARLLRPPAPKDPDHTLNTSLAATTAGRQPPPIPPRYWLWQNLTMREMDVARQVARGLTNAEVAHELGLKPRTVDAYLKSIYTKLDLHSRTQLANVVRELVD